MVSEKEGSAKLVKFKLIIKHFVIIQLIQSFNQKENRRG